MNPRPEQKQMVDRQSAPPAHAWQRIADDIAQDIDRGTYAAGSALPSAVELGTRYGVNRHTVRQAFLHLQALGLLLVTPGRGTIVKDTRLPYRIGRHVSFRANVGRAGLTGKTKILSTVSCEADALIASDLEIEVGQPVWSIETLSLAGRLPLSYARHALPLARFSEFPKRLEAAGGSISAALAQYGLEGYERLSTRITARRVSSEEARWLNLARGDAVLCSLGIDGFDGVPLHRADSRFAASRVAFEVDAGTAETTSPAGAAGARTRNR